MVSDPYALPRWWPRVTRVEEVSDRGWTMVLVSDRGKPIRADYTLAEARPMELLEWQQELDETPFERMLSARASSSSSQHDDDADTTAVVAAVHRAPARPRAAGIADGPPRHPQAPDPGAGAARRDGPVTAPDPRMRWWGWGVDPDATSLPDKARDMLRQAFSMEAEPAPPVELERRALARPALPAAVTRACRRRSWGRRPCARTASRASPHARQELPRPRADARGRRVERPGRGRVPGLARRGDGDARAVLGTPEWPSRRSVAGRAWWVASSRGGTA